jgi:hypothetical protein
VILSSTALLILAFLSGDTPLPLIILALALLGTGFALFQSPLLRTLVASVGREMYGLASGMIETMRLAGMTISVAITTLIFAATIGSTHITPELSGGFTGAVRLILWIFLGISLAALPVTLLMKTPAGR